MSDTYTCSVWTVPEGLEDDFAPAFKRFAAAADEIGGLQGMILQDVEDPNRFIVVRRWEGDDAVKRWQQDDARRHEAGEALARVVPDARQAYLTRKVGDL